MRRQTIGEKLAVQLVLPNDYSTSAPFRRVLAAVRRSGFRGVELNILDPASCSTGELAALLSSSDLTMTMLASGLAAKTFGLSLSSRDEFLRGASVAKTIQMMSFASQFGAGVIIGYLKGSAGGDRDVETRQLSRSLEELVRVAEREGIKLLVEATNRYEATVANSLDDAWALIQPFHSAALEILPDTFHMNLEESNMLHAVARHIGHFSDFHLSDNNRFFPGHGAINFEHVARHLLELGYEGWLGVEGNIKTDVSSDVEFTSGLLHDVFDRCAGHSAPPGDAPHV